MKLQCLLSLIFLFSRQVLAKEKFLLEKGLVVINLPAGWQASKNLFGIPLTLLGPSDSGGRPIVSFTPTGINDLKFDQKSLEQNYAEYKSGREAWLNSKSGKSLEYFPYITDKRNDGVEWHRVGYSYELSEVKFLEYSYYILCGGQLFNAKTLLRQGHEKKYIKDTEEIIRSFECK